MRTDKIIENNKKLSKDCKLGTPEGRQLAILSVLTDISETLALKTDLLASIYGRSIQYQKDDGGKKHDE